MKLLVAEDDPKLLKSLVHILEHNRFSVDGVSNGEDALEYGQTGEYDGLILDTRRPRPPPWPHGHGPASTQRRCAPCAAWCGCDPA
ncbi:response regulator [Flintibacter porci]|uniref:response regulator n=1 Tax=Flintibacter TaxID=1918454 RepID=UPI003F8B7F35